MFGGPFDATSVCFIALKWAKKNVSWPPFPKYAPNVSCPLFPKESYMFRGPCYIDSLKI